MVAVCGTTHSVEHHPVNAGDAGVVDGDVLTIGDSGCGRSDGGAGLAVLQVVGCPDLNPMLACCLTATHQHLQGSRLVGCLGGDMGGDMGGRGKAAYE